MRKTSLLVIILFIGFLSGYCQYLSNPSVEGTILMIGPPPGWEVCNVGSTPNVQPGKYAVYLPPSEGETYVGMLTRIDFTWEDMHTLLDVPFSKDSCYKFKIDLAFWQFLSFTEVEPIVLKVYGSNMDCQKDNLLWQSPPISNEDWITYEFMIHNEEFDITDLILEAYYAGSIAYWGYVLLDNIRIEKTPEFSLGNDTTIYVCEGDSIILDPGSGFAGYLWQDGSTEQTYTVDTTGLYWVQAFNAEGCSWTDSIFVTIGEYMPMVPQMFDSLIVCEGQEVVIGVEVTNGIPPYSCQWAGLPDTTNYITIVADTTQFYVVTITDHCGYTISDSLKLVVKPTPDINLGNDTLICMDGEYTLHAGSGYILYTWQDGSTDSTLTITEPGTYWVTVTSIFGCNATDSINISLFPALPLDLGNDTIACEGETITLYAGEGYVTYTWQDNSSLSEYTATTTGVYWVTVTDDKGCTATDSILVSFLPLPDIDLGEDLAFCSGEQQTITPGPGYESYLWQDGNTSPVYTVTEAGLYWVTVNNGCGEDSDTIYVEVYPQPEPDLGPDTTLCLGQSMTLNPGGPFISYLWQDNSTFSTFNVNTSGIYYVEVENIFGCTATDEIYVSISDPQVNLGQDTHVCEGDSLILDAGEGFVSYLWLNNINTQTQIVKTAGTYGVTVLDEFGCSASDAIEIALYPYPSANLGEDKEICTGEELILMAPEGDFTYYWNGQPGDQNYTVTVSGNYTLTVVNICDSVTDDIQVTVSPYPEVYLGEDEVIFPGQTIELDAGEGHDSIFWQDGSGDRYFVVTENNIDPDNPFYWVAVTEGICTSYDSIKIELFEVWVPKVITPNGDSYNERFEPDPERWQGINRHRIIVFNRWGEQVWESEDFPSGWDGKQNGRYVAEGTYFWVLDVYYGSKEIKQSLKGSLTILGTGQ
jgi:gliding motility-associated-like protein